MISILRRLCRLSYDTSFKCPIYYKDKVTFDRYLSTDTFVGSSLIHNFDNSDYIDTRKCSDKNIDKNDMQLKLNVISEEEENLLVAEIDSLLRKKRYIRGHWDGAIENYKEMERLHWSSDAQRVINRVRSSDIFPRTLDYLPQVHVIDLSPTGYIKPHIDSIKFCGQIVSGLCLLSPCVMRFSCEEGGDDSIVDVLLPPRCLYLMTGRIRYSYTHEILPGTQHFRGKPVVRERRISIISRDISNYIAKTT